MNYPFKIFRFFAQPHCWLDPHIYNYVHSCHRRTCTEYLEPLQKDGSILSPDAIVNIFGSINILVHYHVVSLIGFCFRSQSHMSECASWV